MFPRLRDYDAAGVVGRATLVVAPMIAFQTFPTRGAISLAMIFPLAILAAAYLTRQVPRIPGWEIALASLLALSVIWGDEPTYSVGRLRATLPVLLAAVAAANVVPPRSALRCLKVAVAVMVGSSVILIVVNPAARVADGYSGLAVHGQYDKNTYGGLLVLALLLAVCSRFKLAVVVIPALVVLIVLNKSSTALVLAVALTIAVVALRYLARISPGRSVSTLVWLALSGVGMTVLVLLVSDSFFLNVLGKDPTLSSRTEIWAACWPEIKRAPLLGHGAFTFLDADSQSPVTLRIWAKFTTYYLPPHPHNGLLDVWGQIGLVGLVVFAGLVFQALRNATRAGVRRDATALTAIVCVVFILLFGTTEPTYIGKWLVITVICVAIADSKRATALRGRSPERSPVGVAVPDGGPYGRHRDGSAVDAGTRV